MKFDTFNFNENLCKALDDLKYTDLTEVQEKSIPSILEKKDLLGISKTGTGKTAAFSLPILQMMIDKEKELEIGCPRVVILAPTRELVLQISQNIQDYAKYTDFVIEYAYGGLDVEKQLDNLNKKIDILVITPKRLVDLVKENVISLKYLDFYVIDEVDNVVQSSSRVDLQFINKNLPNKKQCLFFSATMSEEIEKLANKLLKSVVRVKVEDKQCDIYEKVLYVRKEQRDNLLLELLDKKEVKSAIIFANTKRQVDDIVRLLTENKIKSEALHSSKSNTHRTKVVNHIKNRDIKFLIATDLASRGLDIDNITHVINYEVPAKFDDYVHRIGRTGRAGIDGTAFTICTIEDRLNFKVIEQRRKVDMLTHPYHSDVARKATSQKAKPVKKKIKNFSKPKRKKGNGYSNRKGKK